MNKTVLKARYGDELRKNWIHHNNDVSLNDLVTKMQRYFDIKDPSGIKLKYRDEEQDWITLTNDDELAFALASMEVLFVDVISEEQESDELVEMVNSIGSKETSGVPSKQNSYITNDATNLEKFTEIPLNGTVLNGAETPTGAPMSAPTPPVTMGQMYYNPNQPPQQPVAPPPSFPSQMAPQSGLQPSQQHAQFGGMPAPPPISSAFGAPMPAPTPPVSMGGQMYYNQYHQQQPPQQQVGPPSQPPSFPQQVAQPPSGPQQQQQPHPQSQQHQQQFGGMPAPPPVSSAFGAPAPGPTPPAQMYYNQPHQQQPPQQAAAPPQSQMQQFAGMPPPPPVSSVVGSSMVANPFSRQQR